MGCEIENFPCIRKAKEDFINPFLEKVSYINFIVNRNSLFSAIAI